MRNGSMWIRGSALVLAVGLAACQGDSKAGAGSDSLASSDTGAGRGMTASTIPVREFGGDRQVAIEGRQLFLKYNCYGCHGGLAGGAMGPSLRDDTWKFGGTDELILRSIADGRPAGMPTWKGTIPDADMQKLVVYIRSLRSTVEPTFFFAVNDTTTRAGVYPNTNPSP